MSPIRFLVMASLGLCAGNAFADTGPADPNWTTESGWAIDPAGGRKTALAWAPDGSDRLFVLHKDGTVRVLGGALANGGAGSWSTFASETVYAEQEAGLLGIAFDQGFAGNQLLYLFLTGSGTRQRIIRYHAAHPASSRRVALDNLPTRGAINNGGAIAVGHDARLYFGIGELGGGVGVNADLTSLAAKIGRAEIVVSRASYLGTPSNDNPFNDGVGPNNEYIWARGFRDPVSLAVQPSTGVLWAGVTGDVWDQVFVVGRGDHAGYSTYENNQPSPAYTTPRFAYRKAGFDVLPITQVARNDGIATYTTARAHWLRPGYSVAISGTSDGSFASGGGRVDVLATPDATQFTVAQPGLPDVAPSDVGGEAEALPQPGSFVGGVFYDATLAGPDYRGNYFYGDRISGRLMRARIANGSTDLRGLRHVAGLGAGLVAMAVGPDGNLYYADDSSPAIHRLVFNAAGPGIVVDRQHLRMEENGIAVLSVRLATAPADAVTVQATVSGDEDVFLHGTDTLTFTGANWQRPQRLVVAHHGDSDSTDDTAMIVLDADGLDPVDVDVSVRDLGALRPWALFGNGFETP